MQYSPKLKKAMSEIKDILSKHDIAGVVAIHTPGHSEYLLKIDPTYSCARIKDNRFVIKGKLEHYQGDRKLRDQKLSDTVNMLSLLSETTGNVSLTLFPISDHANKLYNADHSDGGFTSHETQNN